MEQSRKLYQDMARQEGQGAVPHRFDRYDFLAAAGIGAVSGLVDVFFVGAPGAGSVLGEWSDTMTDKAVMLFARQAGWHPRAGNEDNVASAIGFLEQNYKVNYDAVRDAAVPGMTPKNHHIESLAHAPDITGLFFSILDQFTNQAHFISNGQIVSIDTSASGFRLQGSGFLGKLYCGFCNWFFHLISDVAGSSGSRGNDGRGTGIPIPFMEWLRMLPVGTFQVGQFRNDFAMVVTKVFQAGYDFRFGIAMAIPVLLNEILLRLFWVLRQHYQYGQSWTWCLREGSGDRNHGLRIMLLVGYGTFCVIDATDAAVKSGGNAVLFFLRMNLWAWLRLIILVLRELFGAAIKHILLSYLRMIAEFWGFVSEKQLILAYRQRMQALDARLARELEAWEAKINETTEIILGELRTINDGQAAMETRKAASIRLAEISHVDEKTIIRSEKDLDDYFTK